MKVTPRHTQSANLSAGSIGKKITYAALAILFAVTTTTSLADVTSRVLESNSTTHKGVLAYVHDASEQGRRTESFFFGQGLRKVRSMAPDFQIQIVGPEEIPGGALPGSFVVLTPLGDRVVTMLHGCKTATALRALILDARTAMGEQAPKLAAYFEYDR